MPLLIFLLSFICSLSNHIYMQIYLGLKLNFKYFKNYHFICKYPFVLWIFFMLLFSECTNSYLSTAHLQCAPRTELSHCHTHCSESHCSAQQVQLSLQFRQRCWGNWEVGNVSTVIPAVHVGKGNLAQCPSIRFSFSLHGHNVLV